MQPACLNMLPADIIFEKVHVDRLHSDARESSLQEQRLLVNDLV